jgi:hypothetical protein
LLQRLAPLGWKYVLVEALIEIPFLLLEFTIWFGPLLGVTIGLRLWQRVLLAIVLYLLVEGGRFVTVTMVFKRQYRFLSAEWELLKAAVAWIARRFHRLFETANAP